MVFWRNRSAKKAETPAIVAEELAQAVPVATPADAEPQQAQPQTNVVTLVTTRLADRLAGVSGSLERIELQSTKDIKPPRVPTELAPIDPVTQPHPFGQKRAVAKIRAALSSKPGEHLLILGEPGSGRLALAETLAGEVVREAAPDWIYVVERHAPSRAKAFAVPGGEGARVAREVRVAIDKASAAFDRHLKSDEHRISLDLLEEEIRYLGDKAVDEVRRRAESQNIAVVKSLDGYILAPMHEGRVVRSDVFRALPEALKRNVEAKISTLEDELQSIVATLPDVEFEASQKHEALVRQTALRAIRPSLAEIKRSCADNASTVAVIDAIEDAFVASAATNAASERPFSPATLIDFAGGEEIPAQRKVVMARRASATEMLGEIGQNAMGRPTHIPGHLSRAGSGFVIIEAWRLAAEPGAWSALSAALASQEITPFDGAGVSIKADPVPLAATVILIADDQSWSKLEAIEPGIGRYFPHVAKLVAAVPAADMPEAEFAKGAARLVADHRLKPLAHDVAPVIYKDAVRRGNGRVSLAGIPLLHLLQDADAIARTNSVSQIRASDVTEALARRADGDAP
jgi:predicted ATP-dependent protease